MCFLPLVEFEKYMHLIGKIVRFHASICPTTPSTMYLTFTYILMFGGSVMDTCIPTKFLSTATNCEFVLLQKSLNDFKATTWRRFRFRLGSSEI